jgi:AbrB family looped-hinge helix DNA binding protein
MTAMLISKFCLTEGMELVHVSTKGQIVIPLAVRKRMHLTAGQRMVLIQNKDTLILKREDDDTILTPAERRQVRRAERELREGKTISHEKLMRELGLE